MFKREYILLCSALMLVSVNGFANEALSRQLSAMRSSVDSFAEVTRDQINAANAEISALKGTMAAYDKCFNDGLVYAPSHSGADGAGCLDVSGNELSGYSVIEVSRQSGSKSGILNTDMSDSDYFTLSFSISGTASRDGGCSYTDESGTKVNLVRVESYQPSRSAEFRIYKSSNGKFYNGSGLHYLRPSPHQIPNSISCGGSKGASFTLIKYRFEPIPF